MSLGIHGPILNEVSYLGFFQSERITASAPLEL